MTPHFKSRKIARLAPYAFDENFLERKAKKIIQAEKARAKWHAKKGV